MPAGKVVTLEDNFEAVRDAVTGKMLMDAAKAGGFVVEGYAKINAGSGRPDNLEMETGHLVNSITVDEIKKGNTKAEVGIGTNVIYARIHELGGIIVPIAAKMLSWVDDLGNRIFAGAVHIPARPYLRPALDEHENDVTKAVEAEIWRNLKKATD